MPLLVPPFFRFWQLFFVFLVFAIFVFLNFAIFVFLNFAIVLLNFHGFCFFFNFAIALRRVS